MYWLIEYKDEKGKRIASIRPAQDNMRIYMQFLKNLIHATEITIKPIDNFEVYGK